MHGVRVQGVLRAKQTTRTSGARFSSKTSLKRKSPVDQRIPAGYRPWYWQRCLKKTKELLPNGGVLIPLKPYLDPQESCDFCGKKQITRCFPLQALEGHKQATAGSECIRTIAKVTRWLKKNGHGPYTPIPKPEKIIQRFLSAGDLDPEEAEILLQNNPYP